MSDDLLIPVVWVGRRTIEQLYPSKETTVPQFADALNHFRATIKPLSDHEQRIVDITEAQFQQVFGDAPTTLTESPACAAHAKPLGRRSAIATALAEAACIVNKAASS